MFKRFLAAPVQESKLMKLSSCIQMQRNRQFSEHQQQEELGLAIFNHVSYGTECLICKAK